MCIFYFQQRAGRTHKRGQGWMDNISVVPKSWLHALDAVLTQVEIVPNTGRAIHCQGGIYISSSKKILAIFSLLPTPPQYRDYNGRMGGVVLNVLFLKIDTSLFGKSLKKAWNHTALKLPPQETATEQLFISLDGNMGEEIEERSFFQMAAEHYKDEAVILYPNPGESARFIELCKDYPTKDIQHEEKTQEYVKNDFEQFKTNNKRSFMIKQFFLGVLVGILLFVVGFYIWPKEDKPDKTEKLLEFSLNRLKKNSQGYYLPLIINLEEFEKGKTKIVIRLASDRNLSQSENHVKKGEKK